MTVYFKKSGNTTYLAGHQVDYTWEVFDRDIWPSPTESQTIVIQEPFSIVNYEGSGLFMGCANTTIEHLDWIDTSQALGFDDMFANCQVTTLDLSSWDTSKIIRMPNMFNSCNYLKSVNLSGWNVSSLENCSNMFYECQALTEIITEENVDWETEARNLYSHDGMFSYCYRLPYYSYYNITDIRGANTNRYFKGVWNWSSKAYTPYEKVDGYWKEISVYVKDSNSWFTTEVYK